MVLSWFAFDWQRWTVASPRDRSTEGAVVRLEQQWFEAQHSCNPDLLGPLMADKVVITGSEPKVTNKADALATCKNTKWDRVRLT